MSVNDTNPAADPVALAHLVKTASTDELRELIRGEQRAAVLEEIFTNMPDVFRPEKAGATDAVVHWRVGDRADGDFDTYELIIADGTCVRSPRPEREPKLVLTIGGVEFLRVVTGNANPLALFMRGKMKAKGDLGLATRIPSMFDPPTA